MHYVIYHALNQILKKRNKAVSVAHGSEIQQVSVWLDSIELVDTHGLNIETDFNILWRQGLIFEYKVDEKIIDTIPLSYSMIKPTTFGVMLYAAAHNKMDHWRTFSMFDFGDFEGISPPKIYATNLKELTNKVIRRGKIVDK